MDHLLLVLLPQLILVLTQLLIEILILWFLALLGAGDYGLSLSQDAYHVQVAALLVISGGGKDFLLLFGVSA